MLEIAIYHENAYYSELLCEWIEKAPVFIRTFVYTYHNKNQFLNDFFVRRRVDVLIADAELIEKMDKQERALLRQRMYGCVLVLTLKEGMLNGDLVRLKPYRCLHEGRAFAGNVNIMKEIIEYAGRKKKNFFLWASVGKMSYRLTPDDIMYVAIAKRGSILHLNPQSAQIKGEKEMYSTAKLSEIFDMVDPHGFAYAHNSYFVNLKYVESYSFSEVKMEGGSTLSISRSKAKDFDDAFQEYWKLRYF